MSPRSRNERSNTLSNLAPTPPRPTRKQARHRVGRLRLGAQHRPRHLDALRQVGDRTLQAGQAGDRASGEGVDVEDVGAAVAERFGEDWIVFPNAAHGTWMEAELRPWQVPGAR